MFSICFKLKRCQVGTYRYKKNQPGPNLNFFTRTFLSLNIFVRYSDVIGNHAVSFLMNIYYFIYYLLVVGAGTWYLLFFYSRLEIRRRMIDNKFVYEKILRVRQA